MQKMLMAEANALVSEGEAEKAASYAADTAKISPHPIKTYDGLCHKTLI